MPSQEENQGKHHYLQQKSRVFTSWVLRSTIWSNGGLMLHFAYICHETKLPVWPVSPQTHWKHLESRLGWPLTSHRVINLSVLAILRSFTNLISLWSDIHHKLPKAQLSCINSRMFNWYHNFFFDAEIIVLFSYLPLLCATLDYYKKLLHVINTHIIV